MCVTCRTRKPKTEFVPLPGASNAEIKRKRWTFCQDCQRRMRAEREADPEKRRKFEMRPYRNRDYCLKALGYASYADYLKSDRWRSIRVRVLKAKNFQCECCGGRAWMVHHNLYGKEQLLGRSLRGLKAVCGPCHERIEFDERRKVGLTEASHRFYAQA